MTLQTTQTPTLAPAGDCYEALGLVVDTDAATLDLMNLPGIPKIRKHYLDKLREEPDPAALCWIVEAYRCLTGERRDEYDKMGHEAYMADGRVPYAPEVVPSWMTLVVEDYVEVLPTVDTDKRAAFLKDMCKGFPAGMAGKLFTGIEGLDVPGMVDGFLDEMGLGDFTALAEYAGTSSPVTVRWSRRKMPVQGRKEIAQPRILNDWDLSWVEPGAAQPEAEIRVSLPDFVGLDEESRMREIFKALECIVPVEGGTGLKLISAQIRTSVQMAKIFGVTSRDEAELVHALASHRDTPTAMARHDVLEAGQLSLFVNLQTRLTTPAQQTLTQD